jgi:ABC-type uncharacterized transport system fused permease/ATPase subunit
MNKKCVCENLFHIEKLTLYLTLFQSQHWLGNSHFNKNHFVKKQHIKNSDQKIVRDFDHYVKTIYGVFFL